MNISKCILQTKRIHVSFINEFSVLHGLHVVVIYNNISIPNFLLYIFAEPFTLLELLFTIYYTSNSHSMY